MIKNFYIFAMWLTFSGVVMGFTIPPTILINNSEQKNSNMNTEIFKDVKGYEGYYQVSNLGNVKGVDRIVKSRLGNDKPIKGKLLKLQNRGNGYKSVTLYKNDVCVTTSVHRLVGLAFIPNPDNKPQINHKNGIKDDNRVENLEWVTISENALHSYRIGTQIPPKPMLGKTGYDCKNSKVVLQFDLSGKFIKEYGSACDAYRQTGINNISAACTGVQKTAGGYKWKYKK